MKLVVVGSVALDTIESPSGHRKEILGGSATYFSVAAGFFTRVHLVAVVGKDFPPEHMDFLRSRKLDLEGLKVSEGKTFRWTGRYEAQNLNEAITLDTQLNVFADFSPRLPESYRDAELLFLGNIDPDLQLHVLEQVKKPKFIACDTMNLWIEHKNDSLKKLIPKVNLLVINESEARLLAGEKNIVRAAQTILSWGADYVCIKRGEYGAILFHAEQIFFVPAYPLEQVKDPTGAGDTFAGGLMGALSREKSIDERALRRAMVHGTIMASYTVEDFSLDRLRSLTDQEISDRILAFKAMTQFD